VPILIADRLPISEDEKAVAFIATVVWLGLTALWLSQLRERKHILGATPWKGVLRVCQLLAVALVYAVLQVASAHDVRDDPRYLYLYTALGGAWIGAFMLGTPWLGISLRDDVVERRNPAAAAALVGWALALGLCFAGGNIGNGPGWWVVVFSSGLATAALCALQLLALTVGPAVELVTVERDLASGLRLAAAAIAEALVLCAAAAGDWVSAEATLRDFAARGWPALCLALAALAFDAALRPRRESPQRSAVACGLLPGAILVSAAVAWLVMLGGPP